MSLAVSKDTQLKRARLYPDIVRLHLDEAKLCANCDTIHTGSSCPTCASTNCFLLSSVIGRMSQSIHVNKHNAFLQTQPYHGRTCSSPMPENKKTDGLKFLLLHLASWLK